MGRPRGERVIAAARKLIANLEHANGVYYIIECDVAHVLELALRDHGMRSAMATRQHRRRRAKR